MYFISFLIFAIGIFGLLTFGGMRLRSANLTTVNGVAVFNLALALVFEYSHLTSRVEVAALGVLIITILAVDYQLLKAHFSDRPAGEKLAAKPASRLFDNYQAEFITSCEVFHRSLPAGTRGNHGQRLCKMWDTALVQLQHANLDGAERIFRLLVSQAKCAATQTNLGGVLVEQRRWQEACDVLSSTGPAPWQQNLNLALALLGLGEAGGAAEILSRYAKEEKPHWKILLALGKCQFKSADFEGACTTFKRAAALAPRRVDIWMQLALCHTRLGAFREAANSYERALAMEPDNATLWYNCGNALSRLGEHQRALESYQMAVQISPNYPKAWNNMGIALNRVGKVDEAIHCFKRSLADAPNYPEAMLNCALAYDSIGAHLAAIEYYRQFLGNAPASMASHRRIVQSRFKELVALRDALSEPAAILS